MKTSFICTTYNEEETVERLLNSLFKQSKLPDEIIIVDAQSSDGTRLIIERLFSGFKKFNKKVKTVLIEKKGNRSVGRNEAIAHATGDIIVSSDAGCILDHEWIEHLVRKFDNPQVDVVAGYYKGLSNTVFERCLVPYALVMEDKVNPHDFLPATRSMAFKKDIWAKVGKFPENYSLNEDYVFARKLQKINATIVFEKKAIVYWLPRKTFKEAYTMFFRFAKGDGQAHMFRKNVLFLFIRYFIAFILIDIFVTTGDMRLMTLLLVLLIVYIIWAVFKNYRYVKHLKALFLLPALQFTADCAVIMGTVNGFLKKPAV